MHSFKNMVANMTNEELQQTLIERIIQERSAQEKKIVSIVIFYFFILLSVQFCVQKFFPHVYTGVVFRSVFLAILIITLFAYFLFKKTILIRNQRFKNIIKNTFVDMGITESDFSTRKDEIIKIIEPDITNKDRNICILYENLKSL
jgi:protein-S-isoprenylcysteine O-methyltransferase Ste14